MPKSSGTRIRARMATLTRPMSRSIQRKATIHPAADATRRPRFSSLLLFLLGLSLIATTRGPANGVAGVNQRIKQTAAMQAATARDLSAAFLGASWADLGW